MKERFGDQFDKKMLFMFNKIRKKRHIVVYEQVNLITSADAENTIEIASHFVETVGKLLGD